MMSKAQELIQKTGLYNEKISVQDLARFCESCATKLKAKGIKTVNSGLVLEALLEADWSELPKGWTEDSLRSFWNSLTGDHKHKITQCIDKMKDHVSDAGAFCGGLASKLGER